MKIDTQEYQSVAAAAQPRFDLYASIHKALRAFMTDTLLALGRVDTGDDEALQRACGQVAGLMDFCRSHLGHENAFVHPALEARATGASAAIAHDHEHHGAEIDRVQQAARALPTLPAEQRPHAAHALYRALAVFVGENFRHMDVEETAHNAVLWARYTDAELVALHDALVASIPPQEMMVVARWMLPALRPAERLAVMADMQAKAPPPAFAAVIDLVRPHLSAGEWAQLARGLGIDAVPGLVVG
ncbi:hemerythrin domain-containing protein [Ramlibacter algicola]|uniref:Hemerythrin domain-containing protein n=1 Tax=Ramlibacter algicola TaxID=2795217 RepID=A0A934UQM6_9BURK|nr:hemerythrin domain-containing protein [Ramlibacter algicola]MBK0391687.1 hemerythrin domain-containing protein [Ramlibacter algicola]